MLPIRSADDRVVAYVAPAGVTGTDANAALLAAAPEMHQRLRDLRNFLYDFLESDPPGISGSRLGHEFQIQHDMTAELVTKAQRRDQ